MVELILPRAKARGNLRMIFVQDFQTISGNCNMNILVLAMQVCNLEFKISDLLFEYSI